MAVGSGRDQALTSEVLRLRKRDEVAALAALQAARAALEDAQSQLHQAEAQAQQRSEAAIAAEQAFAELRGTYSARSLQEAAEDLRQRQRARDRAATALSAARSRLDECREELERANQSCLARRGQREAAELFAAQREGAARRLRASRMRGIEEEARDRFASAKPRRSG